MNLYQRPEILGTAKVGAALSRYPSTYIPTPIISFSKELSGSFFLSPDTFIGVPGIFRSLPRADLRGPSLNFLVFYAFPATRSSPSHNFGESSKI